MASLPTNRSYTSRRSCLRRRSRCLDADDPDADPAAGRLDHDDVAAAAADDRASDRRLHGDSTCGGVGLERADELVHVPSAGVEIAQPDTLTDVDEAVGGVR